MNALVYLRGQIASNFGNGTKLGGLELIPRKMGEIFIKMRIY